MPTSVNIKIGGKAGEGIKTTGLILSKAFSRLGFSIFAYDEYPSLIRGGHNTYQMYADHQAVYSQHQPLDILIALDKQSIQQHTPELKETALVLYDPDEFTVEALETGQAVAIPWAKLAKESGGSAIMANMVSLGAVLTLCGLPTAVLAELITDAFTDKGKEVVLANQKAYQAGETFIKTKYAQQNLQLQMPDKQDQIVVLGNEAVGAGAIAAGMKYYAAYPMTPASSLLHFLAAQAENHKLVVNHVENEIAAINTLIGASAAGVRAMTATSGGGFSLMVEGIGMTGMAEVPAVIMLSMRPGPASGMPTWTGQGDLRFAIHASQDEFPRVVLTPGDAFEAFDLIQKAFVLAETYQLPVIFLVDKYISESHKSGKPWPTEYANQRFGLASKLSQDYRRYQLSESGVSPRPRLGQSGGASIIANSYEHAPDSLVTEDDQERQEQADKRLKKLELIRQDLWELPVFGPKEAPTTLVGFGSTVGPVREALKALPNVNYLHFNYVWPFPTASVKQLLMSQSQVVCIEGNAQGQLQGLIREHTGIKIESSLHKYDGRPFYPEEIIEQVTKLTKTNG